MGQSKYTVVIGYRQELIESCFHPLLPGNIIAAGTMAVPAGIVSFLQISTGVADLPVGTELAAPAVFNIVHDLVLPGVQPVFGPESLTVFPENITNCGT